MTSDYPGVMPQQPSLFRTTTSGTTLTTSSASSSRTIRPDGHGITMSPNMTQDTTDAAMYIHSQSPQYHPRYPHNLSSFPPVPARSSSLHLPLASPQTQTRDGLPSLQVIQPTPSKIIKPRRTSLSGLSSTSTEFTDNADSPLAQRRSTLDVMVEPVSFGSRSRRREDMAEDDGDGEEEDESEVERSRRIEEERRARTREKGRERQRRKRERDRRAKEEAKVAGLQPLPSTSLTTTSHLPIPSRPFPTGQGLPNMTLSLPSSSSSSSYSPPPPGAQQYNVSPNASFASTSVSGQSSPGLLFSPAISTTSYGQNDAGEWTMPMSTSNFDSTVKAKRKGKARALTLGSSQASLPKPQMVPVKVSGSHPAKRRKSEPEPEEFRQSKGKGKEVGLGFDMQDSSARREKAERPQPRRTASDGVALPGTQGTDSRSPTPPVPLLPYEYRRPIQIPPSEAGNFFASTLIFALTSSGLSAALEQSLNIGKDDMEDMKGELAAVFDRWRMEKGFRDVSLESGSVGMSNVSSTQGDLSASSSTAVSSAPLSSHSDSNPTSPIQESLLNSSFFSPASIRTAPRPHQNHSSGVPAYMPLQSSNMPVVGSSNEQPLSGQNLAMHSRAKSMSSTSMAARGLVINPGSSHITGWPGTPTVESGIQLQHRADETMGSPSISLQTPSTGQGQGFQIGDNMESLNYIQQGSSTNHWRSATDPTSGRRYTNDVQSMDWQGSSGVLESPLAMASNGKAQYPHSRPHPSTSPIPPPPPPSFQQAPPPASFTTPQHQRRAHRQAGAGDQTSNHVPFSPATPVLTKDHQNMMDMQYGTPLMYTQSMGPNQNTGTVFQTPDHVSGNGVPGMLMYGYPPGVYGTPQQ